ncbi:MAG TPA: hypothetical protein PLC80_01760 [Draconibacterium sp.]|nr:hypothetical protein [Draconibacterium sp.]
MGELKWTKWKPMPSPENCRNIEGPSGPGVYQIKNKKTNEYIQFGESVACQKRMKSFFPKPYGVGTRNNESKRIYILGNWQNLEYRTLSVDSKEEAVSIDRYLKSLNIHKFNT